MKEGSSKFTSINIGLLLFFALNPYPRWMLPNGATQLFFLITTTIYIFQGHFKLGISNRKIVFGIVLFATYFTLPVIHEFRSGYFLFYLIFIELLFFPARICFGGYKFLKKLFLIVCICSLLVWVIHFVGLDLPYYFYQPLWRMESESVIDNYHIYGPCLTLYQGSSFVGGGLERMCGVFAEPGHFGIYIGLMLAIEKFRTDCKDNIILLVCGILTFSTAFYGIFAMGILYRILSRKGNMKDVKIFILLGILLLPLFMMSEKLREVTYGRVFEYKQDSSLTSVVESRVGDSYKEQFDIFISTPEFIYGFGSTVEKEEMLVTNWRGFVFRYGAVGLLLMMIMYVLAVYDCPYKYKFLLLGIAFLIFSHRAYIMYSPAICMMLYMGRTLYGYPDRVILFKKSKKQKKRLI